MSPLIVQPLTLPSGRPSCHLDGDRDVADVPDVQALQLAAQFIGWILDGFPVHPARRTHVLPPKAGFGRANLLVISMTSTVARR
jgi:hypothetical protein